MKDPHVPQNGLCLLPSQCTDSHISFKDPLRAGAGEAGYLSHLQSWLLDALTVFQMHANVERREPKTNRWGNKRMECVSVEEVETGDQSAEAQQS